MMWIVFTLLACLPKKSTVTYEQSTDVRGYELQDLTINLEAYGVKPVVYPMNRHHKAGSPYGWRQHPIKKKRSLHKGQDIPCKRGTPIRAVAGGTVIVSKRSQSAGKYIEIEHPSKTHTVTTRYMHMRVRHIREGDTVAMGQRIGSCGSTGMSTGPHLHFEVTVDGKAVPPFYRQYKIESSKPE